MRPFIQRSPQLPSTPGLSIREEKFLRQWYETLDIDPTQSPSIETINALATLVQSSPNTVKEHIARKFSPSSKSLSFAEPHSPASHHFPEYTQAKLSRTGYTVKTANAHLPAPTLSLVEKYVNACQRRRAQSDGRRTVNTGPFRCTLGCGYQTKRAFDWRRHEETHEPQELWLCHLCLQNGETNPFLVNRKDKFLGHVKDVHKGWVPETVLGMSVVDFRPTFNPQCPFCPSQSASWDDRCRHILGHYEAEINTALRRNRTLSRSSDGEGSVSEDGGRHSRFGSESADLSNDDADHQSKFEAVEIEEGRDRRPSRDTKPGLGSYDPGDNAPEATTKGFNQ